MQCNVQATRSTAAAASDARPFFRSVKISGVWAGSSWLVACPSPFHSVPPDQTSNKLGVADVSAARGALVGKAGAAL